MNRIAPLPLKNDEKKSNILNIDSISVRPIPTVQSFTPRGVESVGRKIQSFSNNFKLFNKIPMNMRKSEVMRSDSFLPKTLRFLNSDKYTTYDTVYSKSVIVLAVINAVLLLLFMSFLLAYYVKYNATSVYVKKELLTDEFKEKNKELDTFNSVSLAYTISGGIVGGLTFIATIMQFIYVFKKNDFRQ